MIQKAYVFFVVCFFLAKVAWSAPEASPPIYLSFHHRLAGSYLLLAKGESEENKKKILNRAKDYFVAVSKMPIKTIEVVNFQMFLEKYRGDWPQTHDLAMDVQFIETQDPKPLLAFTGKTPRVQRQIDRYFEKERQELAQLTQTLPISSFSTPFKSLEGSMIEIHGWMEQVIDSKVSEFERIGKSVAEKSIGQTTDPMASIFLQTILGEYFARLSPSSKANILAEVMGGNLKAQESEQFRLMILNSGPTLQKFLQVAAQQSGVKLATVAVFKELENSTNPVPWQEVQKMLKAEGNNYDFKSFERKPLGVGSMAQVHRAKMWQNGALVDVIVRFIKPGIEARIAEDHRILSEIAEILDSNEEFRKLGAPRLAPIIEDVSRAVYAELKQEETKKWQMLGSQAYSKSEILKVEGYKNQLEFHVPRIFVGKGPSKLMVQEMVFGRKLNDELELYKESFPDMKRQIVLSLSTLWAEELVFGGGFFHSDFHQGNFLVNITDAKIVVNLLDYGMCGRISPEVQQQLLVLGIGLELKNSEMVARAFWRLSLVDQNKVSKEDFLSLVKLRFSEVHSGREVNNSFEHWVAWSLNSGLRLPYEFISLNRAMLLINSLLKSADVPTSVISLIKKQALKHPQQVYKMLIVDEKVSALELAKVGWAVVAPKSSSQVLRCDAVFL